MAPDFAGRRCRANAEAGLFFPPTVLADVAPGMRIMREETFGPVAAIAPFDTEAEVVTHGLNDTEYGLAAYVFTHDLARAHRAAPMRSAEYGMVGVNAVQITGAPIPFGGVKHSRPRTGRLTPRYRCRVRPSSSMSASPSNAAEALEAGGPAPRTVAAELVETLRELGVRHVFGVPSGGWVEYMEALRVADGIDFILTTHEGAAGMMADVCGRLTGAPGVCFGTYGPGATNLATGVGEALLDRSPMIAFTDEMPAPMRGRTTQMGIDHQALMAPLTKATTRLRPDAVRETLLAAARTALTPRRGPVPVGLPTDLSTTPSTGDAAATFDSLPASRAPDALLELARRRLAAARRPFMAIGLGAVRAGVGKQALAIAEARGMPVVLTPMAKGVIAEDHPLYAGVLFHALSDVVGETHRQADLVVAVGYDPVEFNYESWLSERAALVSLDDESADIDRSAYDLSVDVVGDIGSLRWIVSW